MDKESIFELQKIDCNCNDCKFMARDLTRRPIKGSYNKISYGTCEKFKKEVSFIPTFCQPDNQECFIHRKLKP